MLGARQCPNRQLCPHEVTYESLAAAAGQVATIPCLTPDAETTHQCILRETARLSVIAGQPPRLGFCAPLIQRKQEGFRPGSPAELPKIIRLAANLSAPGFFENTAEFMDKPRKLRDLEEQTKNFNLVASAPEVTSCTSLNRRRSGLPDICAIPRWSPGPTYSPPASKFSEPSPPQKLDSPPAAPVPEHPMAANQC